MRLLLSIVISSLASYSFLVCSAEVTVDELKISIEEHSLKGEAPPRHIQDRVIKAYDNGEEEIIQMVESSSNPYTCCAYNCGYTGCSYKRVRYKSCKVIGTSVASKYCK